MRNIWSSMKAESWGAWWSAVKYAFNKKKTGCELLIVSFIWPNDDPNQPDVFVSELYTNVTDFQHHLGAGTLSYYADGAYAVMQDENVHQLRDADQKKLTVLPKKSMTRARMYYVLKDGAYLRYQMIGDFEYRTDSQAEARRRDDIDVNKLMVSPSSESSFVRS